MIEDKNVGMCSIEYGKLFAGLKIGEQFSIRSETGRWVENIVYITWCKTNEGFTKHIR